LRVGCFAFGGAYAAIPLIREVVLSYGWLTEDVLTYMIAVSESTPGPIMVNLATYVGNMQGGIFGAIVATLAVVLPSFIVILIFALAMKKLVKNKYIQAVLKGLKSCVVGVILAMGVCMIFSNSGLKMGDSNFDMRATTITVVLVAIMWGAKPLLKKKISPILLIALSAVLGIVVYGIW